jgi:hypothetical protein
MPQNLMLTVQFDFLPDGGLGANIDDVGRSQLFSAIEPNCRDVRAAMRLAVVIYAP